MDRDGTYSLISVNADDDEEIVIQTGVPRTVGIDESDSADEYETEHDDAEYVAADETADFGTDSGSSDADPVPPASKAAEPRYRETTQEDLNSIEPMSKMQKIVIACVFLFIAAFAAYYLFLR